jgi:anti-sigma B factor antagonist
MIVGATKCGARYMLKIRSHCAAQRLNNTAHQLCCGCVAPRCDLRYTVRSMNVSSDLSTDSCLQVATHAPDARVVTVEGQIDTPTALELATLLTGQLTVARVVVVDLDGVRFLGSTGLSALFEANELAAQQDRVLRLVCNSRIASWALAAVGLREYFTFADSVPDAVNNSQATGVGISRRLDQRRRRRSQSLLRRRRAGGRDRRSPHPAAR